MLIQNLVLLMAATCFGSFAWGVGGHFRKLGETPPGMRWLSLASLLVFGGFLLRLLQQGPTVIWPISTLLMLVALGLFWWAVATTRLQRLTLAFSTDIPHFMHQSGPYRHVRHPFYSAYMLFWIATTASAPGLLDGFGALGLCIVYLHAARSEERKFLASPLRLNYRRYQHDTGLMLPALRRRLPPIG